MEIITETLSEAHEAACAVIMEQHNEIDIQTHIDKKEFTLEFAGPNGSDDSLTLRILKPWAEPKLSLATQYGPGFTAQYRKQFLTITPPREDGKHATYTYFNRLADFPTIECDSDDGWIVTRGNGDQHGFDQITHLCHKLSTDPKSRRGVVVTWNPFLDANSSEPPCMDILQAIIRNHVLNLRVMFRSQDMLMGLPENLIGCESLQKYMCDKINAMAGSLIVGQGNLTLFSWTPHIYKKRDGDDFDRMRQEIHRKKTLGLWHPKILQ